MFDKKGMILVETLVFFTILMILVTILFQCAMLEHQMYDIERKGFDDEKLQEIYHS